MALPILMVPSMGALAASGSTQSSVLTAQPAAGALVDGASVDGASVDGASEAAGASVDEEPSSSPPHAAIVSALAMANANTRVDVRFMFLPRGAPDGAGL